MNRNHSELIRVLPEPLVLVSGQGAILACNAGFAALIGMRQSELAGSSLVELFSADPEQTREFLQRCSRTSGPVLGVLGRASSGERYRCEGGTLDGEGETCVWIRYTPGHVAIQRFAALNSQIQTLGREIAARTRSEAEARESKDRLDYLAQASSLLASSLDYEATLAAITRLTVPRFADWCTVHLRQEDGSIRELATHHKDPAKREMAAEWSRRYPLNPRSPYGAPRVLGSGRTEIMKSIPDSVLAEVAADEEQLRRLRELGLKSYVCVPLIAREKILGALTLITAESERRYKAADVELLEDLARRCAVAVDNAKLHQEAVRASSLLRTVLQQMPIGVVIAEAPSGRIIFNSDSDQKIMGKGFQPTQTVSEFHRLAPVFPGVDPADLPLARSLRGETVPEVDLNFLRSDGAPRVMRTSSTPVLDQQGKVIAAVGVFQDVTDKLAAEDALRKSERLAAAGRFAATVAHEINNPLEAATNLVYLAKRESEGQQLQYLELAECELKRVAQISRKTLGFYKDTGGPQTFALAAALEQVVNLYQTHAERQGVRLQTQIRGEAAIVRASQGELQQVFSNLIANAIDACSAGDRVMARLAVVNERARVTIADSGSGIRPKNLERIWEPFFTTKQNTGTGLGLWVTRDLAQKNGGRIRVRSRHERPPTGSVFSVSFPLASSQL